MTPEQELLISLARKALDENHIGRVTRILKSRDIKWDVFLDGLEKNNLTPICYFHLKESLYQHIRLVPNEVQHIMFLHYEECILNNYYVFKTLEMLVRIFNEQSINMLVVKGPVMIDTIYHHVGIRPIGDLDVLVSPKDLTAANELMKANGYVTNIVDLSTQKHISVPEVYTFGWQLRNHYHLIGHCLNQYLDYHDLIEEGRTFLSHYGLELTNDRIRTWMMLKKWPARTWVELHHSLVSPSAEYDFKTENLLSNCEQLKMANELLVSTLPPEDLLIYHCEHLYKESTYYFHIRIGNDQSLMKYCDVRELIKQFDANSTWDVFIERVRETRMEKPVYYVFYCIGEIYGGDSLIEKLLARLKPDDVSYVNKFNATGNITGVYKSENYRWRSDFISRLFSDRYAEARQIVEFRDRQHGVFECQYTPVPPVSLNDTIWTQFLSTKISETNVPKWQPFNSHVQIGIPPRSDNDLSFYVSHCWDYDNFYLLVTVMDDVIVTSGSDTIGYFHDRDAVRLYFDTDYEKPITSMIFLLDPSSENKVICINQLSNDVLFKSQRYREVTAFADIHENKYTIAATIPFTVLGIVPQSGIEFGFDIEVSDCDNVEYGVKTILVWSGGENRNEFDRSVYGKVVLVDRLYSEI